MRPNFDRIAEVMWNQMKQSVPRLISGAKLSAPELFGDTMPKGSMAPYRKTLIEADIIDNDLTGRGVLLGDKDKALAFIESPMAVANVLWPSEAEEWREHIVHVEELRKKKVAEDAATQEQKNLAYDEAYRRKTASNTLPKAMESLMKLESLMQPIPERSVIKSKSFPDDLSSARAALQMSNSFGGSFVVARPAPAVVKPPVPEVKAVEIKLQQPPPPEKVVEPPAPTVAADDELVAIEFAKLKLMHATAENMVYIRDRLDGLIKRPPPQAPPAQTIIQKEVEVQVVKVPVLPKEIPVVLTVVNAEHIDARFEALEQTLNEVLTILRKLL